MKTTMKKILSVVTALALCAGLVGLLPQATEPVEVNAAVAKQVNVGVDFNGTDNRAELRHATFLDWMVPECQEATYEYEEGGLTFTVKNATTNGKGKIKTTAIKDIVNTEGNSNLLTVDGLRTTAFSGGAISLEIAGLPAGTHTITTWHSYNWLNSARSTFSVSINGEVVNTGLVAACKAQDDNLATITYNSFEAVEGEPVVITIAIEGTKQATDTIALLNAFEIDGVHPLKSIQNAVPADAEAHHEQEDGLSWKAAEGAVAHRVYFGDDKYTVSVASRDFPEFEGEQTETYFDLSGYDLDHMKTYYWRVDEVFSDGTVLTGKVYSFNLAHLAFPTAEGYGRYAKGGRGGEVIEVTTLKDGYVPVLDEEGNPVLDETGAEVTEPIEGSLRWAIESFTGPRTVVFRVSGVIELTDMLTIDGNHGQIYIAGQTAPGDGITITNYTFGASGATDVIIRDVRVRIGDNCRKSMGGMGLGGCNYSIIDHCSISWALDEGFSSRNANNITFQRNIIGETLNNSYHYAASGSGSVDGRVPGATERHSFAASIGGNIGSFHHNLLINNTGRNWSLAGGVASSGEYAGYLDIRYNVVYNWQNRTTDGGSRQVQFVGNYYKMGAVSRDMNIFSIDGDELGHSGIVTDDEGNPVRDENGKYIGTGDWQIAYVAENKMVDTEGNILLDPVLDDPWKKATVANTNNNLYDKSLAMSDAPFFESYIAESTADEAYNSVIADVGAKYPALDYIDARYIEEVSNGTYTYTGGLDGLAGIIDSQEDVGGYPTEEDIEFTSWPEDYDTDHDGMPNEWETLHGLNPDNAADGKVITLSAEGYTNLEMYLCELMGDPLVWKNEDQKPDPTATPTPEVTDTPAPTYTLGNVDDNPAIDAADALAVLKHAAKLDTLEGDALLAANVTKDEVIDAADALDILKYAAKLITSFE